MLLRSWKESLEIFYPKNFKTFASFALNTWKKAWKIAGPYLAVLFAVIYLSVHAPILFNNLLGVAVAQVLAQWRLLVVILFLAAARPSVGQKNSTYFKKLIPHMVVIALMPLAALLLTPIVYPINALVVANIIEGNLCHWSVLVALIFSIYIVAVWCLFALFLFDGPFSVVFHALKNAMVFVVYNAPLCGIIMLIYALVIFMPFLPLKNALPTLDMQDIALLQITLTLYWVVLTTLFLSICTAIYSKRVSESPNLYA